MSLSDEPFEWKVTKTGKLLIYRGEKHVMIVSPEKAVSVLARLGKNADEDQQVIARITGQYRIGNEREPGSKRD